MPDDKPDGVNRPAHTIKMHSIEAVIWRADGKFGPYYSVRFVKRFKDHDGNWVETHGYTAIDCLALAKLADAAHTWMLANPPVGPPRPESPRPKSEPPPARSPTVPTSQAEMARLMRPLPRRRDVPDDDEDGDEPIPF